jgi:hypothetical protein
MTNDYPFVRFHVGSRAFFTRASSQMLAFRSDENDVSKLLYAALELRFGIEARVSEYLATAMQNLGHEATEVTDYIASKLLKRLTQIEPNYDQAGKVRLTNDKTGHQTVLEFTPVRRELASIHGKLGEMLHYKMFLNNKDWQFKKPLQNPSSRSIGDFAELVDTGISQLGDATRGLLLGHIRFTEIVSEMINKTESGSNE